MYEGARSTDDTEFAILTAQTLIDWRGELTLSRVAESWRKYILGQGGMGDRGGKPLYGAVANLARGMEPPQTGLDNPQNDDDGAAMRIAPVGIICPGNPSRAAEISGIEAQISHARDGVWGAQAVAASVAVALDDATPQEIVAVGVKQVPVDSWLGRALDRALGICQKYQTIEDAWEHLHIDLWNPVHSMVAEALPQAYSIFLLTGGDFRKGMYWACNFGRDADTIAALVGAMSGAIHGCEAIPQDWMNKVRRPAGVCLKFAAQCDIVEVAQQLVEMTYERA
jgi:ADP-ribosylglycohydrolase